MGCSGSWGKRVLSLLITHVLEILESIGGTPGLGALVLWGYPRNRGYCIRAVRGTRVVAILILV